MNVDTLDLVLDLPKNPAGASAPAPAALSADVACRLGSPAFRREYGLRYAYLTGSMYRGIASKEIVIAMGRAGMLGFLGTGGLSIERIGQDISAIETALDQGQAWGANLIANLHDPAMEMSTVRLYIERQVRTIEASAFMQITPALVVYRAHGMEQAADGRVHCRNRLIAKLSRPEVARAFMSPAPERLLTRLLAEGAITATQAEMLRQIPMATDLCVEADSGGHTDQGVALVMLSGIQRLRDEMGIEPEALRIGLAGGIGSPEAVAAGFVMGADFVMTGSINQCTVEAGTSDLVKQMLQEVDIQDTDYAPAGDMFEMGAKVQVMKKGVFFPARASRLHALYTQYGSLEEIPASVREQLEQKYFRRSLDAIWAETQDFFRSRGQQAEIDKALAQPKHRMALVFRWYFGHSMRVAFAGDEAHRVDFQVHTGPAMGAFNRWVRGGAWESWRERHVDRIGERLMLDAATLMLQRITALQWPACPEVAHA